MGATWVGQSGDTPPREVDHAVSFAPAGAVIPEALAALRKGGTLSLAGIYVDRVPEMDYERHLFEERTLVSVTANTRADARELLTLAASLDVRCDIETYDLADANEALLRLKTNRLTAQAAVLQVGR
jgi:propanol-preferring alcohol dehydrogenase